MEKVKRRAIPRKINIPIEKVNLGPAFKVERNKTKPWHRRLIDAIIRW